MPRHDGTTVRLTRTQRRRRALQRAHAPSRARRHQGPGKNTPARVDTPGTPIDTDVEAEMIERRVRPCATCAAPTDRYRCGQCHATFKDATRQHQGHTPGAATPAAAAFAGEPPAPGTRELRPCRDCDAPTLHARCADCHTEHLRTIGRSS
jgi:hypothetical protein